MTINVCQKCGKEYKDFDTNIRFRCVYCNAKFPNWENKFRRELEKALDTHQDERKDGEVG